MWDKIITIKRTKDLNYFSLCAFNLFNTQISQFEFNYWNKWTFPRHSNLLRCTCTWQNTSYKRSRWADSSWGSSFTRDALKTQTHSYENALQKKRLRVIFSTDCTLTVSPLSPASWTWGATQMKPWATQYCYFTTWFNQLMNQTSYRIGR